MNRARPVDVDGKVEAAKARVVERALFDVPGPATFAFPGSGKCVKVAGAAPVTVACNENLSAEVSALIHRVAPGRIRFRGCVIGGFLSTKPGTGGDSRD